MKPSLRWNLGSLSFLSFCLYSAILYWTAILSSTANSCCRAFALPSLVPSLARYFSSQLCFVLFCLLRYIRPSDGLGDTLFKGPFRVFVPPLVSVFVTAGTALVLVSISVVTVCCVCVVAWTFLIVTQTKVPNRAYRTLSSNGRSFWHRYSHF
jgi:hypothetical protein